MCENGIENQHDSVTFIILIIIVAEAVHPWGENAERNQVER